MFVFCNPQSEKKKDSYWYILFSDHRRIVQVNASRIYDKTLPKAQQTQSIEPFESFNTMSSKKKIQVITFNNPFRNFDKNHVTALETFIYQFW